MLRDTMLISILVLGLIIKDVFTCRPLSGDPSSMYCLKVLLILLERVLLIVIDK